MFKIGSGITFSGGITFDTVAKYQVSASSSSIGEGDSVTYTVTTNVDDNVPLYWTTSGTSASVDFSDDTLSGSITRTNGVGTVVRTVAVDQANEVNETMVFEIRTGSTSGQIVASASSVTITNIAITYSVTPDTTSITEGESVTWTVTTTNFGSGTLYYAIGGTVATEDVSGGLEGSVTITDNSGTITKTFTADQINESAETATLYIRTDSSQGTTVATSSSVTVNNLAITYSVTPSTITPTEGDTVTWTINTTNFGNGTLYWTLGGTATGADYTNTALSGSVTITDNVGTLSKTIATDQTNDVNETAIFQLRTSSTSGTIVATASTVTITNVTITYAITPSVTTVSEGSTVTWTVTTTNFGSGSLYYSIAGGTATTADYTSASSTGTITITNNTGTFSKTITSDYLTEGSETLIALLKITGPAGTTVATSATVTITDSSTSSIVPNTTTPTEGATVTWTVTTSDFGSGTLYWTLTGTASTSDYSPTATSGSVSITSNTGTISKTISNDIVSDGGETMIMALRTGSTSGPIIATASTVTITNAVPTYAIAPGASTVNETGTVTWTVTTTNYGSGTLYYKIEGTAQSTDYVENSTGSVSITNNTGSFSTTLVADLQTEGSETLIATLREGSSNGTILATSTTVTITDSSKVTATPNLTIISEGATVTWTISAPTFGTGTLYYDIVNESGSVSGDDFSDSARWGYVNITNDAGSLSKTLVSTPDDFENNGEETLTLNLYNGTSTWDPLVATSTVYVIENGIVYTSSLYSGASYTWTCPPHVTSVSVLCVGGGGSGGYTNSTDFTHQAGGGGGGLAYCNNVTVVPGTTYDVFVGGGGISDAAENAYLKDSWFISNTAICAKGGADANLQTAGAGGSYILSTSYGTSRAGRTGGNGGAASATVYSGGGGGAAGYTGNGGNGGGASAATAGAGGGAGGGGKGVLGSDGKHWSGGCGGGVGVYGPGTSGALGTAGTSSVPYGGGGGGGSGGTSGYTSNVLNWASMNVVNGQYSSFEAGGNYGGGGGGCYRDSVNESVSIVGRGDGGQGVVRLIWPGNTRSFPSTNVGNI